MPGESAAHGKYFRELDRKRERGRKYMMIRKGLRR